MKKIALLAAVLAVMPIMAFAHGSEHGGGHSGKYQLCPYSDCSIAGNHYHGGTRYSGHYADDGHGHR